MWPCRKAGHIFYCMTPIPAAASSATFKDLGIAQSILTILEKNRFDTPTPIQHQSIPAAITGVDVVGIAQTGTGKTLAFGIPMIQRLGIHKGRGLIILPTRELALQVNETLEKIGKPLGLRTVVLIGGENIGKQIRALQTTPHVIIATPGRLVDHLDQKTVSLNFVKILVLDEADRMFDMGFLPQLNKIFRVLPKERQTMLFSATMPAEIMKIASAHMKAPIRIEVAPQGTSAEKVEQEFYFVRKESKLQLLEKILTQYSGTVLVFSRTKHGAKKICKALLNMGHQSAEIHSNKSLAQRIKALDGFKSGKYRVLVATDIAARGIDVKNIELVINYDLPDQTEDYVHRIGRTGRAGTEGRAISFATPDQKNDIKNIEKLIRKTIRVSALPELPAPRIVAHSAPSYGGNPAQHSANNPFRRQGSSDGRPQHRQGGFGQNRTEGQSAERRPGGRINTAPPSAAAPAARPAHRRSNDRRPNRFGGQTKYR